MKDNYNALSGAEKSSVLLLSLGDQHAGRILEHLNDEEIKILSKNMIKLGHVTSDVLEKIFLEFASQISATGTIVGSIDTTQRLLSKYLADDRVSRIMEDISEPTGHTTWDKLSHVKEDILANYLKNEYPQTVAVILSKINPEQAANILKFLPESFSVEVILRMLRIDFIQKDVLEEIEKTLNTEFINNLGRTSHRDSHELVADMFNHLDRASENKFFQALDECSKIEADKIRSFMFTFEDLIRLDSSAIQVILRTADKNQLTLSLKGASDNVKGLFFSNMSERAGKILKEDMQDMGMVRLKDVDEAQSYIVKVTKDLAHAKEIILPEGKLDDEFVY